MRIIFQGLILGLIVVLPGMSGGTAFLILGLYDKAIKDFSRLNIKPYLPLLGGSLVGVFLGGFIFSYLFYLSRDITSSFLLGALLASVKIVLKEKPGITPQRLLIFFTAFLLGLYFARTPLALTDVSVDATNPMLLFVSGAISSATMLIPGISGSSILIIMGVYDEVLYFLKELVIFKLLLFASGGLVGFFLLAKFMEKLYFKYKSSVAYFFAGLIIGSAKTLFPYSWNLESVAALLGGLALIWWWSGRYNP